MVGGGIPSARSKSVVASGARVFCHPAYFTILGSWEMREHLVISRWFGIDGSLCPNYVGPVFTYGSLVASVATEGGPVCALRRSNSQAKDRAIFAKKTTSASGTG